MWNIVIQLAVGCSDLFNFRCSGCSPLGGTWLWNRTISTYLYHIFVYLLVPHICLQMFPQAVTWSPLSLAAFTSDLSVFFILCRRPGTPQIPDKAHSRFVPSQWETVLFCIDVSHWQGASLGSAMSASAPSQWETPLLCNAVSHWLGAKLESALSDNNENCRRWANIGTEPAFDQRWTNLHYCLGNVRGNGDWAAFTQQDHVR